jgi:uncharacterized protein (TIRG00374 family)
MKLLARAAALVVGLLIGLILLALLLRSVSPDQLAAAFTEADYRVLLLAVVPFVAIVWIKVVRWALLFGEAPPAGRTLFGALNAGYAVNTLLPLRMGELVTAYWVRDASEVPMMRTLSTIAVERVSDGMAVLILLIVTAPTVAFPRRLVIPAATIGALLCVAVVVLGVLSYASATERPWLVSVLERLEQGRLRAVAAGLHQGLTGLRGLRSGRALTLFLMYTAVIWSSNALLLWLVVRAFHLDVTLTAGFLLTGVLYLGMAVPSSPGYVGVFDYLMVLTLGLYGQPHARSVAAAFAAHVINFVPVTLIGLAYLGRHGFVKTLRYLPRE